MKPYESSVTDAVERCSSHTAPGTNGKHAAFAALPA
jgi:hypothetical protein